MSVFISYSHADQDFVDRLSLRLLNENIKVWRDEYKLSAGDSLTARIKDAIERASFLCVVISDSALASEWVRREIEVGLLREADSYRLTIIPLLLKDVEIPEPLKDRLWVDFRRDIAAGLTQLVGLLRRHYAVDDSSGTIEDADYFLYYGSEEGWVDGRYYLALDVVSFDREERFCLLTQVTFRGNDAATAEGLKARDIQSCRTYILRACSRAFAADPARVEVSAARSTRATFFIESEDGRLRFDARAEVKMLGAHRAETVVFNIGALFSQIAANSGIAVEKA
jgi:hypothetical protein